MTDRRSYWDERYRTVGETSVSWYQAHPRASFDLIAHAGLDRSSALVDVGGGAGTLVDALVADGWSDITVLDVSGAALAAARDRVGPDSPVQWVEHDLLTWDPPCTYDVWHDRAVFHFLVDEADRLAYRDVLRRALAPGGTVVVGTFAADGPESCSGLPVVRYDAAELVQAVGGLDLVASTREEHVTPGGAIQPFTWVVLRDKAQE